MQPPFAATLSDLGITSTADMLQRAEETLRFQPRLREDYDRRTRFFLDSLRPR